MPLVTLSMQAGVQRVCFEREYKELAALKDQQAPGNGLNGSVAFPKDAHTRLKAMQVSIELLLLTSDSNVCTQMVARA